jgi:hypothetical protein
MALPYTITEKAITVVVAYRPHVIPTSHPNFEQIRALLADKNTTEEQIKPLIDIPKAIETFTGGNVTVVNGRLFYKGYEVRSSLASLILKFVKEGQAAAARPFELFLEKAFENPDPRAALDLYDWVARSGLPITPEGNILAWKAVRADYGSIHGNPPLSRFDHHVGNIVQEDRMHCDPDPNRTCSRGLHFCSADYLSNYADGGRRVVALEISPTDVVAFPKDANGAKGRAWKYKVVGEVPPDEAASFYPQGRMVYDPAPKKVESKPKTGPKRDAQGRFIGSGSKPKKAKKQDNGTFASAADLPVKKGQIWQTRDGQRVTITGDNGHGVVSYKGKTGATQYVFGATGSGNFANLKLARKSYEAAKDLIKKLSC